MEPARALQSSCCWSQAMHFTTVWQWSQVGSSVVWNVGFRKSLSNFMEQFSTQTTIHSECSTRRILKQGQMWTYTKLKNNLQLKQNIHSVHDKALALLPNMRHYLMSQRTTKTLLHLLVHCLCCVILFRKKKKKKILQHTFI